MCLTERQMDRRHHAARAPAGQLDRGKREREKPGEAFDRRALCGREMRSGPGGKDEQLFVAVLQLERVPGEVGDLIPVEGDDGLAGCGKASCARSPAAPGRRSSPVRRARTAFRRTT